MKRSLDRTKRSDCGCRLRDFRKYRRLWSPSSNRCSIGRAEPGSVDAAYYAYVLNALMAMDGSHIALQRYEQYLEECRELTRFRRNRDRSYEWLGDGSGIARLVHQSRLGDWDRDLGFWKNTEPLARVAGRVARITGPQAGFIELAGGLEAFFVPAKSGLSAGSENTPILDSLAKSLCRSN